jgi:mannose-6-phosphate isomerase-like protein (cupin superfamily)
LDAVTSHPPVQPLLVPDGTGEALWFLGSLATVRLGGSQTAGGLTIVEFLNPPGFAAPLHRHTVEDEVFLLLAGRARFFCGDEVLGAGPGDVVLLPRGIPHTFVVDAGEALRTLQITSPGGFDDFVREAGEPAGARVIPEPTAVDPARLGRIAALHGIEILGPPPHT